MLKTAKKAKAGLTCCAEHPASPCPPYFGLSILDQQRRLAFVIWANERPSFLMCLLVIDGDLILEFCPVIGYSG